MNKTDLIEAISQEADISKAAATRALNAMTGSITLELCNGGQVELVGFGKFSVRERPARMGRNPQTGEPIDIKAAMLPVFKAGKQLKGAIQNKASQETSDKDSN